MMKPIFRHDRQRWLFSFVDQVSTSMMTARLKLHGRGHDIDTKTRSYDVMTIFHAPAEQQGGFAKRQKKTDRHGRGWVMVQHWLEMALSYLCSGTSTICVHNHARIAILSRHIPP